MALLYCTCRTSRHSVDLLDTLLLYRWSMIEHLDVVIVGLASPASAAPGTCRTGVHQEYAILESRDNLGGTWDMFKYPGIRRTRHVHAGFPVQAVDVGGAIADGPSIMSYTEGDHPESGIDSTSCTGTRWWPPLVR